MTKIYSIAALALSAMVCINASAGITKFPASSLSKNQSAITKVQTINIATNRVASRAEAAISAEDVAGTYDMTAINELRGSYVAGEVQITVVSDNEINIAGITYGGTINATVAADGTVTIPTDQYLSYEKDYDEYVYFRHYVWEEGYSGISASDEPIIGKYDPEAQAITFDEDDLFMVEGKSASTDAWTGSTDGYYQGWDSMVLVKQAEAIDDSADWTSCGTADFVDGWIYTCYSMDQFENVVKEVPVEKSVVEDGVYRLVDPYHNENHLASTVNQSTKIGYIQFSIANPEFPFIYPDVKAGFANSNGDFYCYDINGFYHILYGYSADIILDAGIQGLSTYDAETGVIDIPDAIFGISSNPTGGYTWQDAAGAPVDMTSQIKLNFVTTGIEAISISDKNAPAEYYNLQGVRVANPAAGQVYIRVQGNKAQKIIR